jgi:DNA-binding ferritin-like protein
MDVGREQAESLKKLNETRSILDNLGFDKIKTKLSEIFDPKNQAEYNLKLQQSAGMLLHFYGIIKEQTKIIRTGKAKIEILPVEDIREQIALIEHYEQVLKDFTKNGGEGLEGLAEAYEDLVEKGDPYTQQLIKQQNELEEFKKEVDKACDDIQKLGGLFIDLAGAMGLSSEASSYLSDALNSITSGLQAAASGDLIGVITSAISIHIDAISQLIDDLSRSNEEILEDWQAIIDEGLEGSREMWDLMREMEEEGMEVAEVQDYIAEKIQKGISALNNYYNYAATSQERFNNAQVYTLAMFSALIAQGATFIEAVLEMQDEFQRLAEIVSEMGYETAAAFDFLLDFSEWIEANQDLVNAAQAVGDILDSVFESGIYNLTQLQAIIYTVGADLYDMFYGAIGAGATREEAWALIIPQLNDLIYYSQEYGLKIDQQTAELIAAAQAEGYLTELMIPVEEKQVWLLEEILLVLGGTIPYLSGIFDNTLSGKFPGLPDEGGEGGGEDFNFPHEFAEGGRFWAHRPTTITVGEGGESEFVSITPRSKISSDSGKNLSVALTVGGINLYGGQNPDDVIRALKNSIIENKFDITSIITDKVLEYVN